MTTYNLKYPTQRKIKERMDKLQEWMEMDYHLEHPQEVTEVSESVSKFWTSLQEEDKDYIHGVRHAIEEKTPWRT
jgi:hypothetical protein